MRTTLAAQILNATDTDLSAFERYGGKLLMYFGWADPQLNPLMGVEYYEKVVEKMGGKTTDFFRLHGTRYVPLRRRHRSTRADLGGIDSGEAPQYTSVQSREEIFT